MTFLIRMLSLLLLFSIIGLNAYAETVAGKIVWAKGSVSASSSQGRRSLERNSPVYEHDTILTGKDSQAQIAFSDNSMMSLHPNTTFTISQYKYGASKKGSMGKYVMNLIAGGFRSITGLIAKSNPNDYQITTPVATIGVRGTDYSVEYPCIKQGTNNYVCGKLYIRGAAGTVVLRNAQGTVLIGPKHAPYAEVGKNQPPKALSSEPRVFQGLDEEMQAAGITGTSSPATSTEGGGTESSSGSSSQTASTSTTAENSETSIDTTPASTTEAGPMTEVSSFCIN